MTSLSNNLTPGQLLSLRFEAQSTDDFATIYHSAHRLSTLRRSFPSLKEYVAFARENLSGQITIDSFAVLAEQLFTKKAYVLCSVALIVQGKHESFIEVAELRRSVLGWRFLHCFRLPISALPEDLSALDLKQLSAHPEAVVY